jgi:hypothetical protein
MTCHSHGAMARRKGWWVESQGKEIEHCDPIQNPHDPSSVLSNFHHVYMMDFLAGRHNSLSVIYNTSHRENLKDLCC